jgi:hypothetical protein
VKGGKPPLVHITVAHMWRLTQNGQLLKKNLLGWLRFSRTPDIFFPTTDGAPPHHKKTFLKKGILFVLRKIKK